MELIPISESVTELSIILTDDAEIQELNRAYRSKDKPTDVLSFSQLEAAEENEPVFSLGDVIISTETADRQAKDIGHTFNDEIARLLTHGILHLYGFDHEGVPEEDAEYMFYTQEEILMGLREDPFFK